MTAVADHLGTGLSTARFEDLDLVGALCAGSDVDPEEWFPERVEERRTPAYAAALCAGCPVSAACLELALRTDHEVTGIWGGLPEDTVEQLRKRRIAEENGSTRRPGCRLCGEPVERQRSRTARWRRYCSDGCRRRASELGSHPHLASRARGGRR